MFIRDAIFACFMFVVLAVVFMMLVSKHRIETSPHFTVTELVQCRGHICNAVLDMDDIAILVPFDSTKVHVGDKIYLVK